MSGPPPPESTQDTFARWHAEAGVHPYVLADGDPVAYGEVWEDREEDEAELARVIVAPPMRGRGVGRTLIASLAGEARAMGFDEIWVRVVPVERRRPCLLPRRRVRAHGRGRGGTLQHRAAQGLRLDAPAPRPSELTRVPT